MMYKMIRPLLFRIDPEGIHDLILRRLERDPWWVRAGEPFWKYRHPMLRTSLWGVRFENPVGLAAGFDKRGACIPVWPRLGFGFAEIGTITAVEQEGNPKPRLFRLPEDRALINRFGFNNPGADATADRLSRHSPHRIPLGVNIGKSKVAELKDAAGDYLKSFARLRPFADYFVVNVSSPNTPNLRQLQDRAYLTDILAALRSHNAPTHKPILLKIAPDLTWPQIDEVLAVVIEQHVDGVVATNTTVTRDHLRSARAVETGGLSGAPVRGRSTEIIRYIRRQADVPIVGVGGIFTADDAYEKIRSGAALVQLYTGFVYEGPGACAAILRGLVRRLQRDGFQSLDQAIGVDAHVAFAKP